MLLESFTRQPCRRSLSELDLLVKFYRFFFPPQASKSVNICLYKILKESEFQ